jgi:maltooligosyltrehalose trehalohydrolase
MDSATKNPPRRRCGALPNPDGSVRWRVWAPRAERIDLVLIDGDQHQAHTMEREDRGYFHCTLRDIPEGQRYTYQISNGRELPDPCSLWQPQGVHGPSAVVRTDRFRWTDQGWKGVPRQDLVFYELHVGTFTPEGTFEAIIPRLPELRRLGVTAIEVLPVAQFPGQRNWGYDGVCLYAAQDSYGGPHGLQRLIDACHAAGLAFFLDVVYNHFGPEGNYLAEFGPYFTDHYKTPWGSAVNYDGAGSDAVRDFVVDNARTWLEDFHCDGLRLDAVHAIYDLSARHILRDIEETAEGVARRRGRPAHIVAESDLNDPRLLLPPERGGYGLAAQWSDDFHHAVHSYLTGETQGYYSDFGRAEHLARVLEQPFLYAGDYSPHRDRRHGAPPTGLTGDRFVVAIQNHDQVGNRASGDRLSALLKPAQQRLAASLLLLSPHLPLLFMGEEYGEENPFPFFCSFGDPELVQAVREGRRREFAAFAWQGEVPDPHAETTFAAARLSWSWPEDSQRAGLRRLYADLLAARHDWPALGDFVHRTVRLHGGGDGPVLELVRGQPSEVPSVQAIFNLSGQGRPLPETLRSSTGQEVLFSSESRRHGGARADLQRVTDLLPWECVVLGPGGWKRFE